jgi:hypothetical protein
VAGPGSALTLVEFCHVGGALQRAAPGAGAQATLPGNIAFLSLGVVPEPALNPVEQDGLRADGDARPRTSSATTRTS